MGVGIDVEHLNAWYGTTHTLQDINLNIPANHATALIGPSGCGKSTFVRCLNRMHETNPIARATGVVKMGDMDIYKDASAGGDPAAHRDGVSAAEPVSDDVDLRQCGERVEAEWVSQRAVLDETVERSLKQAALWEEVKDDLKKKSGREPFGRPAAADVHCAGAGGRSRGAADG